MSFLIKAGKKCKEHPCLTAAFVSLLMLLIYSLIQRIFPFGGATFLRKDLYHQYLPFLYEFRRRLVNGQSLRYSFDLGLGDSFYAMYVYYLSDPLNFLSVLVPEDMLLEFLTVITYLKIALASGFMCRYIRYRCPHTRTLMSVLLSLCYGFSGYVAAYDWNVMWMWGIALAPLVIMGFEMMVKGEGISLYLIAMALTVWTNYYIAMVVGIFLVVYFVVLVIEEIRDVIMLLKAFLCFVFATAVAGGISAVLLIPEYIAIRSTSFTGRSFPHEPEFYLSLPKLLLRTLMSVGVETGLGHEPALYASIIMLIFIPLFFMNGRIPLKYKITRGILIVFFFLSFDLNILEFIWHGFNYPDSIPARQAFLFVIICIISAAMALDGIEEMGWIRLIIALLVPAVICIVCVLTCWGEEHTDVSVWVMNALFINMYCIIGGVFIFSRGEFGKWGYYSFAVVLLFELVFNFNMTSVRDVSRDSYFMHAGSYGRLAEEAKKDVNLNQGLFTRFDTVDENIRNISCLAGYHDASFFSSTIDRDITEFYESFGMKSSRVHYMGEGLTPFTSAIMSIDHVLANEFRNNQTDFDIAVFRDEYDDDYLYADSYCLPFGYAVPAADYDLDMAKENSYDPVDLQNTVSKMLGGGEIFHSIDSRYISVGDEETVIDIPEEGHYYAYTFDDVKAVTEYTEFDDEAYGVFKDMKYESIMDLGRLDKGGTVTLKADEDSAPDIALYRFDPVNMQKLCDGLSMETLTLTAFEDDHIEGLIEISEDKQLLLAMPVSEGWEILIDGEKSIEPGSFFGLFMLIPVPEGLHHISLTYHIPHFITGLLLSVVSLLTAGLMIFVSIRNRKYRGLKKADGVVK